MQQKRRIAAAMAALILLAMPSKATAMEATPISSGGCGWYIVLHCGKSIAGAAAKHSELGGPAAGGGAGLSIIDTRDYPNFRSGYHCVVDGPYATKSDAQSIAWSEAVPDAYVKNAC